MLDFCDYANLADLPAHPQAYGCFESRNVLENTTSLESASLESRVSIMLWDWNRCFAVLGALSYELCKYDVYAFND
jgi:hypothetical protein